MPSMPQPASAPSASAGKLSPDFRRTFERTFTPKRTFAVVMQKGVPTTSIYGVKGDSTGAHYSIDVVDGRWKTSSGLFDFDQTMADWLELGEIMELDSIAYRDNRVDLRMVSREAHKVTRGSGFSQRTTPEPVATNFKFFLPYPQAQELTAAEVPAAVAAIDPDLADTAALIRGHAAVAQRRPGRVHHARAQVAVRRGRVGQGAPLAVQRDEGVLHELLGDGGVAGEQCGQPDERVPVRGVEHRHGGLGVPGRGVVRAHLGALGPTGPDQPRGVRGSRAVDGRRVVRTARGAAESARAHRRCRLRR